MPLIEREFADVGADLCAGHQFAASPAQVMKHPSRHRFGQLLVQFRLALTERKRCFLHSTEKKYQTTLTDWVAAYRQHPYFSVRISS
jgi:hypothetical protein